MSCNCFKKLFGDKESWTVPQFEGGAKGTFKVSSTKIKLIGIFTL